MVDPLTVPCPKCFADPGVACWNLAKWYQDHTKHVHEERFRVVYPLYPCPTYVTRLDGTRRYCQQGATGHYGTCYGNKSKKEYNAERKAIIKQRREARAAR